MHASACRVLYVYEYEHRVPGGSYFSLQPTGSATFGLVLLKNVLLKGPVSRDFLPRCLRLRRLDCPSAVPDSNQLVSVL